MNTLVATRRGDGVRFAVRVQPRASRSELVGVHGEALKVRIAAPPVDGAANDALVRLLAAVLNVGRGDVRIISGGSARSKIVEVDGIGPERMEKLAAGLAGQTQT